ncbi:MAG TPA: hypothetical protein PKH31_12580 [Candidatus Sumerlaeota bacterium]|nr:hypothetical protein [Candidatus Sumerlaeota bacterium]
MWDRRLIQILVVLFFLVSVVGLFRAVVAGAEGEMPVPRGNRLLGMAVSESENKNFDAAMALAKSAGVQVVNLKLDWDEVEKKPGVFDSPWPKVANLYYPPQKVQLSLRLSTLDTSQNRIPKDLRGKPFDDPAVIERFNRFLDYVLDQMPDLTLAELSIGNEVDGVLGTDEKKWEQYARFFVATREHAGQKRKDLKVGVSIMFSGHTGPAARCAEAINRQTDVVMVSYYPLDSAFKVRDPKVVHEDFETICQKYPKRPISFLEAGYPSGERCGSSELKQQQFVEELFAAWDRHAEQIECITFVWLNDTSASAVKGFTKYYGSSNPAFVDYLSTLGLRTFKGAGVDKLGFTALKMQSKARGW